jgi:hypothetical protein
VSRESRWVAMPSEEGMTSSDSQGMAYRPDRVSASVVVGRCCVVVGRSVHTIASSCLLFIASIVALAPPLLLTFWPS